MTTRFLLILSTALLCRGECVQVGPANPQFGRIEVSAFALFGEPLPTLGIEIIDVSTHKTLKSSPRGNVAKKIPYGTYLVRVSAPGFRRSEREILLDQPELSIRMQLSVAVECGGFAEIHGNIRRSPDGELWVKLVPLQGVGGAEARVNRDGSFLVGGLDDGQYLLLVVDGKAIVHTASILLPRNSPLDIDLLKN